MATATFKVGPKHTVTLSLPSVPAGQPCEMQAQWKPDIPKHMSAKMLKDYRHGRDKLLAWFGREPNRIEIVRDGPPRAVVRYDQQAGDVSGWSGLI